MAVTDTPRRRWYQFSLRTMFVGVTLVSIPLAWVGYSLRWIKERNDWRDNSAHLGFTGMFEYPGSEDQATAPGWLWVFGDYGLGTIWCLPSQRETVRRIFPEADFEPMDQKALAELLDEAQRALAEAQAAREPSEEAIKQIQAVIEETQRIMEQSQPARGATPDRPN